MITRKIGIVVLVLLLAVMAIVPLVSASENESFDLSTKYQLSRLQNNDSQEKIIISDEFRLSNVTMKTYTRKNEIPVGSTIYHQENITRVFDSNGKQLSMIDDANSKKILTPKGYSPATQVYQVPNGALIRKNGEITQVINKGELISTIVNKNITSQIIPDIPFGGGWIEAAKNDAIPNLGRFSAVWYAPTSPTKINSPSTVFLFTGIMPQFTTPTGTTLIQPVLEWNDSIPHHWSARPWYITNDGGNFTTSDSISVDAGDKITGLMDWNSDTQNWTIIITDNTKSLSLNIDDHRFWTDYLKVGCTLEGYGVVDNSDLPGATTFSNMTFKNTNNQNIVFSWAKWYDSTAISKFQGLFVDTTSQDQVTLFTCKTWTISPTHGQHGTTSPANPVSVNQGWDYTVGIMPDPGFDIYNFQINGLFVGIPPTNQYTFTNVQHDNSLYVTFIQAFYLTPRFNIGGIVIPSSTVNVPQGGNQTFTVASNSSYVIDSIQIDDINQTIMNTTYQNVTLSNVQANSTIVATFKSAFQIPTVSSITPATGSNTTTISITNLAGTNFVSGATVKLNRSGYADIPGTSVSVVSPTQITCSFDLTNKISGQYNVVVTNTDGRNGILTNGFIVTPPSVVASFTASPTFGPVPLAVQFTDTSQNNPTGWAWFFGDENYTQPWIRMNASAWGGGRFGFGSVAMPDGSIVLMGGGDNYGNYYNDTWRSTDKGSTWVRQTASAGWGPRGLLSSAVLPDGSIVIMGGWQDVGPWYQDVWRSSDLGITWSQVNASVPGIKRGMASVVLSDGSIVVMGGNNNWVVKNDVWRSSDKGTTWVQQTPSAGWTAREMFSGVALPDDSIVIMGGVLLNDTWRSTDRGVSWVLMNASSGWHPRYAFTSNAMPDGSIVIMGGQDTDYFSSNELWRSIDKGAIWTRTNASTGWSPNIYLQGSVVLPDGSIIEMGGADASDVWRMQPSGSMVQNPIHTFNSPRNYSVILQAYNSGGHNLSSVRYVNVTGSTTTPTVTSITPSTGVNTTTISITNLSGTNFASGATVKLNRTGYSDITGTSVTVVSATNITCSFNLTNKIAGQYNVVVNNTNGKNGMLANGFTITAPSSAPTVTGITPATGVNTTTISITNLAGTNFATGVTVKLNRTGYADISGTSVTVVSATNITCSFNLTNKIAGQYNIVVNNTNGQNGMLSNGFTVTAPSSAPTVTGITPNTGVNTTSVSITNLSGTNFAAGATVKLNRTGYADISGTSLTVVSPTNITCSFNLTNKIAGQYNVVVNNTNGQNGMLANGFTITYPTTAPTVTSITPSTGVNTTSVSITNLSGTNFAAGSAVLLTPANSRPVHKGSIEDGAGGALLSSPQSAYIVGNYAYVASTASNALEIVNVSNPASPVHRGSISNGAGGALLSSPSSVFVSGTYAYVASSGSNALEIVNVSNPASPVHKGSIANGAGGALLSNPSAVYVSGNYAYVASTDSNALEIVNITNLASPAHKGSIANGAGGAALNSPSSVYVSGNYAYVTSYGSNALEIVDVSNPASPVHKGKIVDGSGGANLYSPTNVYVSGNYAYVTGFGDALEIVDVSNPASPVHKGSIEDGAGGALLHYPTSVSVSGNYAYVSSSASNAIEVVDVSNPSSPVHKGSIVNGAGGALLDNPYNVFISGNYAYISSYYDNALEIVDIGSVTGTNVTVVSPTKITCSVNLVNKIAGQYNVVVTNADGQIASLTNGFTITN